MKNLLRRHTLFSLKKKLQNLASLVLIVSLSFSFFVPTLTSAASLTSASDTMSNETQGATSDHTFAWTSAASHSYVAGDTITIASSTASNFTSAGTWATTDFQLTMAGGTNGTSATNPVAVASSSPSCSAGAGHYTVTYTNSTTPSFVITLCTSFGTTGTAGAVTFVVKGATGTGTLTNKSSAVSSALWTITNAGSAPEAGDATSIADVIITNDVVTVTATVSPTLTFSLGSNTISLGTLTSTARATGAHTLSVATNGASGFAVSYNGASLTSTGTGAHVLTPYTAGHAPTVGTEGWGINLAANTLPAAFGADPVENASGGPSCAAATNYNTADQYTFAAGSTTTVSNMSAPADCTYTVSYVANISTITPAGSYSTALTYIATGTF